MSHDPALRSRLIELANEIQGSLDTGVECAKAVLEFHQLLPDTDIENLCRSDMSAETIVGICLGEKDEKVILSREELLILVRRIMHGEPTGFESEAKLHSAVDLFVKNCRHPAKTDLIFFPDEHFDGNPNPTPEEVVDKALAGE